MNPVVHFELPYRDSSRAARFYEQAFGWSTRHLGPEMGNYVLVTTATADARSGAPAGAIDGGLFACTDDPTSQAPGIVIAVEAIEPAIERIKAAGGRTSGEAWEIPGVGRYASFFDTEGNRGAILQPTTPGPA